jgi:hypothetical protein
MFVATACPSGDRKSWKRDDFTTNFPEKLSSNSRFVQLPQLNEMLAKRLSPHRVAVANVRRPSGPYGHVSVLVRQNAIKLFSVGVRVENLNELGFVLDQKTADQRKVLAEIFALLRLGDGDVGQFAGDVWTGRHAAWIGCRFFGQSASEVQRFVGAQACFFGEYPVVAGAGEIWEEERMNFVILWVFLKASYKASGPHSSCTTSRTS